MSSTYVDGTTPLDAAHMNALQQKVEKGLANGYASLDSGVKVPIAQLPSGTASGLATLDANGKLTQTQVPLGYGTSLPASPVDGQEYVLVDSTTAPTYQWRFRYNAGSSSVYKWEFIGGTPAVVNVAAGATATGGWVEGDTNCRVTVPRAGDYVVSASGRIYLTTSGTLCQVGIAIAANPAGTVVLIGEARFSLAADSRCGYAGTIRYAGRAANDIFCQAISNGSGDSQSVTYGYRSLSVIPARVS